MALTRDEVLHIAELADLELQPEEVDGLMHDLIAILDHVEQLRELDTSEVPITAHLGARAMPLREDRPRPSLGQEVALREGPEVAAGGFAVPRFVDE